MAHHRKNPILQTANGSQPLTPFNNITGRTKNKFEQGFLGGVGSDSQFQTVFNLPIQPVNSNNDLLSRMMSTTSASWDRSYAFAPGRGLDARATQITNTYDETVDTATGVIHPVIFPGIDRINANPAPPLNAEAQGINALQTVPRVLTGGERAENVGKLISSGIGGQGRSNNLRNGGGTVASRKAERVAYQK